MKLTIYSLKGIDFEGEVEGFNVETESGEITILDNHRPLLTLLKKGTAFIIKKGGVYEKKEINSGFLEVMPGSRVSVLVG